MRAVAFLAGLLALSAVSQSASADVASWHFVQSVGGLLIGEPVREGGGWSLPVRADVSGLSKVTVQPTTLNSGIACLETRASVENSKIILVIVTSIAGPGREARCPAATLGQIAPGRYSVVYRESPGRGVSLGSVVIAR